jgi:uncharacterized membrane protein YedE/YeeE
LWVQKRAGTSPSSPQGHNHRSLILVNLALVLLFGLGLVISGMFDPARVLNFLDLFGTRDPSLAFVNGERRSRGIRRLSAGAAA